MDARAAAEFSEFAHGRWAGLVRLGYGLTGDRGLAEDLAQTALASAHASWSRLRKADDPDAYLRKILLNAHRSSAASWRTRSPSPLAGNSTWSAGSGQASRRCPGRAPASWLWGLSTAGR